MSKLQKNKRSFIITMDNTNEFKISENEYKKLSKWLENGGEGFIKLKNGDYINSEFIASIRREEVQSL